MKLLVVLAASASSQVFADEAINQCDYARQKQQEVAAGPTQEISAATLRVIEERLPGWIADRERSKLPRLRIGMTRETVLKKSSWGKPSSINRTTTAQGVTEQWVYRSDPNDGEPDYLYFTNGKLTAIQD